MAAYCSSKPDVSLRIFRDYSRDENHRCEQLEPHGIPTGHDARLGRDFDAEYSTRIQSC